MKTEIGKKAVKIILKGDILFSILNTEFNFIKRMAHCQSAFCLKKDIKKNELY